MKAIAFALAFSLVAAPLKASTSAPEASNEQIYDAAGGAVSARAIASNKQGVHSLTTWSARVMDDVTRGMRVRDDLGALGPSEGIVAVKFNCSESGAPAGVELMKSSGNREYDIATLRAVRRIASLHPLPTGLSHDQKYIIRVLFASSEYRAGQKIAQMRRDAEHANAWYLKTGTTTAALELAPTG